MLMFISFLTSFVMHAVVFVFLLPVAMTPNWLIEQHHHPNQIEQQEMNEIDLYREELEELDELEFEFGELKDFMTDEEIIKLEESFEMLKDELNGLILELMEPEFEQKFQYDLDDLNKVNTRGDIEI